MQISIDCNAIQSRESFHQVFASALSFPEWYGSNLDSLHDCLTSLSGTVRLDNWRNVWEAMAVAPGRCFFRQLSKMNP